jgi:hypothetical protein
MHRVLRATALVTVIAMVAQLSVPALAANEVTVEGTVQIPCDPSLVSEVALIQLRPVSGGTGRTVPVDSSTGKFDIPDLTEGEYELIAIGVDGQPLSPEAKKLTLGAGSNQVVLSFDPPGCGEPVAEGDEAPDAEGKKKPRRKSGLKDWHLTLMYFGVVTAAALILYDDDDDEDQASPMAP